MTLFFAVEIGLVEKSAHKEWQNCYREWRTSTKSAIISKHPGSVCPCTPHPKDPNVLKHYDKAHDSERLRCNVFAIPPNFNMPWPLLTEKSASKPRKKASVQGESRWQFHLLCAVHLQRRIFSMAGWMGCDCPLEGRETSWPPDQECPYTLTTFSALIHWWGFCHLYFWVFHEVRIPNESKQISEDVGPSPF